MTRERDDVADYDAYCELQHEDYDDRDEDLDDGPCTHLFNGDRCELCDAPFPTHYDDDINGHINPITDED